MERILDGIMVLEVATGPAAAFATMFLADQGARVIRLLPPGTPHLRDGGFIVWDRGKDVVHLDLRRDPAAFDDLLARADVIVEDFAPSAPEQALLDSGRVRQVAPRLVTCSITAYGKQGPWKDDPPIDDLVMARTGILGGMPGFRPAPVHVVFPLPTVGAALYAANGIAAALLARETTGRGRAVETSLMAGALLYHPKVTGEHLQPNQWQTHPSGSAPFYSLYECADGRWVQLGCVHVGFIATCAGLLGIGDLIKEPRFDQGRGGGGDNEAELRATLARILRTKPYSEWAVAFEAADVPFAPARLTEEGFDDPQVEHNGMVVTLEDPVRGPVVQMGVPIAFSATPGAAARPRAARPITADAIPAAAPPPAPSRTTPAERPPLDGIRVLEITNLIAGPTGGRILAELGADVIKLEPPGGDMSRPIGRTYFYAVNFDKRSVAVDTSKPEGKAVVRRIAKTVDALLANVRPQATARMGLDTTLNPRLIETHLTGYGWTGPYSKRPGIDPLAQAYMGLSRAQGGPENPPVFAAQLAPTDFTTGAMGALGTILALYHRQRTGVVQRVDSNLLSGGIVLSSAWFTRYAGRPERPLADKEQMGLGPCHRLVNVSDGWIYLAADTEAQQQALARLTSGGKSLPALTRQAALSSLAAAGIPAAEVTSPDSDWFLAHAQARANGMVAERQHPTAGRFWVSWQTIAFPGGTPTAGLPTPLLGEHTEAVLRESGYTDAEIAALYEARTVLTERPKRSA